MKKILLNVFTLLTVFLLSSCLNGNLEDLPSFEEAEISSVNKVEYRYISDEISDASQQQIVKNVTLSHSITKDSDSGTLAISVKVPDNFPKDQLGNLSSSALVVSVNLSSAARIAPVNGSASLGVPADWSKSNKYVITAGNGNKKEWTIILTLNK